MRQNTPHPKELKAKAHKLFAKGGQNSSLEDSELLQQQQQEQQEHHLSQQQEQPPPVVAEAINRNVRDPVVESRQQQPESVEQAIGNGQEETSEDDDTDYVSIIISIIFYLFPSFCCYSILTHFCNLKNK